MLSAKLLKETYIPHSDLILAWPHERASLLVFTSKVRKLCDAIQPVPDQRG